MKYFIIFEDGEKQATKFDYALGETITVNSAWVEECYKKEIVESETHMYFRIVEEL